MICPYNHIRVKEVTQTRYEYDEDGRNVLNETVQSISRNCLECPKEGCAVWRDGKCKYYGDS